jgi:predicted MFS family arabinose efflux permease
MLRSILSAYRNAFSGLNRATWLLCSATLVNRSGTMVLPFLTLYLTRERGFTITQAGQALAAYGIGGIFGSYLGGWLCDRLDARRVMVASLALTGAGFFRLGHLRTRPAILLTMGCLSLVGEAFRPASATALAAASPPEMRARAFALSRLAINLGMTLGPTIGGFLALYDYGWLFVADGGTCVLAAVLLWASFREELRVTAPRPAAAAGGGMSPWRDGPFLALLFLLFLLGTAFFQLLSTFPLTMRDLYHFSEARIGLALAINTVIIVAFEMVLVHRLSGRDPLRLLGLGSFLVCAGLGILPFGVSLGFLYVALSVGIWTLGEMLTLPLVAGVIANHADEANRGRYMGLFTIAFEGASVAAPLCGTWVYQRFGPRFLWNAVGLLGLVIWAGFAAVARRWRSPAQALVATEAPAEA